VDGLAYSPDGRRVATVGSDRGIRLRDPGQGLKLTGALGDDATYYRVAYSRDGRLLAAADLDAVIRVFEVATGRELGRLSGHGVAVYALAFDPLAARLASAGGDYAVKLWDLKNFLEVLTLRQHDHEVYSVSFSPDGRLLASAGFDGSIRIRGLDSATLPDTDGWPVIFADDFNRAEIGGRWETTLGRWSIEKGSLRGVPVPVPSDIERATAVPRGVKLPSTVEIRFECWTPGPILFETKLLTATETEGLIAQIPYPDTSGNRFGPPGGRLMVRSGGHFTVAEGRQFNARAGQHYRVRIVRAADRLTLLVDDQKIFSAHVRNLDAPVLQLQGSWGEAGSIVYLDNLEIRAPNDSSAGQAR
jgi:hypothetical protein